MPNESALSADRMQNSHAKKSIILRQSGVADGQSGRE
jgi:hypothetical protein